MFVLVHECLYVYQVSVCVYRRPDESLLGEHNIFQNRWLKYFIQFILFLIIMVTKEWLFIQQNSQLKYGQI